MRNTSPDLDYCVVCQRPYTTDHRCPPQTLAAMRAAERRAENWYDPTHPSLPPDIRDQDRFQIGPGEYV